MPSKEKATTKSTSYAENKEKTAEKKEGKTSIAGFAD